jgi:outer membrane protein OmpA-like peptidoglycan-associated protein
MAMNRGGANPVVTEQSARARDSLARAEQSYADHGPTRETRELALVAERDALTVQVACIKGGGTIELSEELRAEERLRAALTAVPGTVMFEFDESELLPAAKERLDQLAQALNAVNKNGRTQNITVEGYADSKGDPEYNRELSERRATAVRDYLSTQGYDPSLVQVRAMGQTHPFTTNATVEGRANNRRVEIILGDKKIGE